MGRYAIRALRVADKAALIHANSRTSKTLPKWFAAVESNPPAQILDRTRPQEHPVIRQRVRTNPETQLPEVHITADKAKASRKGKKPKGLFLPAEMKYEEDELRQAFYKDHPWELARPRVVLESTGNSHKNYDWSRMEQAGKALDGESVVQRQLYLLNTVPDMTTPEAYDIARREFYALRHKEDIERRVAVEEALSTGAYFGMTNNEVSMQLEDKQYANWKAWAERQEASLQQRTAAFSGAAQIEDTEEQASAQS